MGFKNQVAVCKIHNGWSFFWMLENGGQGYGGVGVFHSWRTVDEI